MSLLSVSVLPDVRLRLQLTFDYIDNTLYTLHQNYNAVTQHTLPALNSGTSPQLVANITTIPPSTTSSSGMEAAGLLYAESPSGSSSSPLLYASNRNDPSSLGDAITIFEIAPTLKAVAWVRTGVQHARALGFVGPNKEYIAVGGMNGGGIKIYKRVAASAGYLTQVAAFPAGKIYQPLGFTWV
jgi:hypothetical protein